MDKATFYSLLYYRFIGTLVIGFIWYVIVETWGHRACLITSKDIQHGVLKPTRDINKTTPRINKNMTPEDWNAVYTHDDAYVFERDLGVVYVDRSLSAYSIVVKRGTHVVVDGSVGCKHLIASTVIESGQPRPDWDYHPNCGIIEANQVIDG